MIGALICEHSMQQGWTRRLPATRAVQLTPEGERAFRESFGAQVVSISIDWSREGRVAS